MNKKICESEKNTFTILFKWLREKKIKFRHTITKKFNEKIILKTNKKNKSHEFRHF